MPNKEYFFQQKKRMFAQKFFEKGFTVSSYILLALKESGESLLEELPDSYCWLMKDMLGVKKYKKPQIKKQSLYVNLSRLRKQGLIAKDPKKKMYCLTDKGEEFVLYIKDRFSALKKPWDGKLRIVIFDIPEKKKHWREWLRSELSLMQFKMLQQSVYIGRHALSQDFYKELEDKDLLGHVFILTVGDIDRKEQVLELFNKNF